MKVNRRSNKDVWQFVVPRINFTHHVGYLTDVSKIKIRADLLSFIGPKHIFTQNN